MQAALAKKTDISKKSTDQSSNKNDMTCSGGGSRLEVNSSVLGIDDAQDKG